MICKLNRHEIGLNIVREKNILQVMASSLLLVEQGGGVYLTNMKRNKVDAGLKVEAARLATFLQRME
jgi:hypothetical protein